MLARVRRTRPQTISTLPAEEAPEPTTRRVRRSRPPAADTGRTIYVIDWDTSLGGKLQLYLMTSYLYYEMHRSLILDTDYDRLCHELLAGWGEFEHMHKGLTDRGQLRAGTGYAIKYPLRVKEAAMYLLSLHGDV